jgi:HKD family nuclease
MNIGRSFDTISQLSENGTHIYIYNKMYTTLNNAKILEQLMMVKETH